MENFRQLSPLSALVLFGDHTNVRAVSVRISPSNRAIVHFPHKYINYSKNFKLGILTYSEYSAFEMKVNKTKRDVNPDLAKERLKCNFNIEEVTYIIDGGKEKTLQRKKIGEFYSRRLTYLNTRIITDIYKFSLKIM